MDSIRLTYWHTYTAEQDSLRFSSSAGRQVAISGFTSPSIRVADITNPRQVQEVTGVVVEPEGPGYAREVRGDRDRKANPAGLHRGSDQVTCEHHR